MPEDFLHSFPALIEITLPEPSVSRTGIRFSCGYETAGISAYIETQLSFLE